MLISSIILTIISAVLWRNTVNSKLLSAKVAVLIFISLLAAGFFYVANYFSGSGIDESVLFHLKADMTGAGLNDFTPIIIYSVIYLIIIVFFSIITYQNVTKKRSSKRIKTRVALASSTLLAAFIVNPATVDVASLTAQIYWPNKNIQYPENYIALDNQAIKLRNKNLVFLYLESVERTYLDESLFPDLMPNLKQIESSSLSFLNIKQIMGSGWTIGGMVSSQCGVPLVTPSGGNSMSGMYEFLPGALCLGDILSDAGYNLNYIGGASLEFAGKRNFYETHGFNRIEGFDELITQTDDTSYRSGWGLYDDTLLGILKKRYDEYAKTDQPFGLFALTLDTHHPQGHVSAYCQNVRYLDGSNPMLNAVHCADEMLAEIYDYITTHDEFENTILVIASDHLAMPNDASDLLEQGDRKNLLLIVGEDISSDSVIKLGAAIDVAPTILNLLDANIKGLGFGRDLLSTNNTLTEQFENPKSVSNYLKSHRQFISNLWSFPQINSGFFVDLDNTQVSLGKNVIEFPALIVLNESSQVHEIRFDFNSPIKLSEQISKQDPGQNFIWIDGCNKVNVFNNQLDMALQTDYCIALGSLGAQTVSIVELTENQYISNQQLTNSFERLEIDLSLVSERSHQLEFVAQYGLSLSDSFSLDPDLHGAFLLKSVGGVNQGKSTVENLALDELAKPERGLTLYGLLGDSLPIPIQHFDTCGMTVDDLTGGNYSFQDDISRLDSDFGGFLIIAHDSAVCGSRDLSPLFANTGLTEFDKIEHRTPYVAIIAGNNSVKEYVGKSEETLLIEAVSFLSNQ